MQSVFSYDGPRDVMKSFYFMIDSFNYFSQFKKDGIHTFAFYSFYFTIWQNPSFKCITNAPSIKQIWKGS